MVDVEADGPTPGDTSRSFKHLRRTAHTYNALDDARGNAEALLAMKRDGLKITLD